MKKMCLKTQDFDFGTTDFLGLILACNKTNFLEANSIWFGFPIF